MATVEKKFHKGEMIVEEGRFGESYYVINYGSVEVFKRKADREARLAVLGKYEFFGEMSLLDPDSTLRSASVRALEETEVSVMSKEEFKNYLGHLTPGAENLIRHLVKRLRATSKQL